MHRGERWAIVAAALWCAIAMALCAWARHLAVFALGELHDRHGAGGVQPGAPELADRSGADRVPGAGDVDARRRDAHRHVHRSLRRGRGDAPLGPGRRLRRGHRAAAGRGASSPRVCPISASDCPPMRRRRVRLRRRRHCARRCATTARCFVTLGIGVLLVSAVRATRQAVIPLWADHLAIEASRGVADLRAGRRRRHAGVLSGRQGDGPEGPQLGGRAVDADHGPGAAADAAGTRALDAAARGDGARLRQRHRCGDDHDASAPTTRPASAVRTSSACGG